MAIFEVTFDVSELDEQLQDMSDDVMAKRSAVMSVVAEMLVSAVSDRYDTEGDGEWEPHSASYAKKLARLGMSGKLLQTGMGGQRLSASTEPRSGPDYAEASTSVPYVVYHLDGGPVIPKRNPFEIGDGPLDEIEDYILEQMSKAAGG